MSKVQITKHELEQRQPEPADLALGQAVQTEAGQVLWSAYEEARRSRLSEIRDHLPQQISHQENRLTDQAVSGTILNHPTQSEQAAPITNNETASTSEVAVEQTTLLSWKRVRNLFPVLNSQQSASEIHAQRMAAKRLAAQEKTMTKAA